MFNKAISPTVLHIAQTTPAFMTDGIGVLCLVSPPSFMAIFLAAPSPFPAHKKTHAHGMGLCLMDLPYAAFFWLLRARRASSSAAQT